jgi:hypothetical protein
MDDRVIFAVAEALPNAPLLPVFGAAADPKLLFQSIPAEDWRSAIRIAAPGETPEALLVPHNWRYAHKFGGAEYAARVVADARARQLPIVLVDYADKPPEPPFPAVLFWPSTYASTSGPNVISAPASIEDPGRTGVTVAPWSARPSVGFVGRACFDGLKDFARYIARTWLCRHPRKDGRYYRRAAAAALAKDPLVDTGFVFRRRYSGNLASIELSPEAARREYLGNMRAHAYGLAPKGDGNYSLRFYELLSLGRIPVVPDTDMGFPLADLVPYDDFVVKVPLADLGRAGEILRAWHEARGPEGLAAASRAARAAFERYLYAPRFFAEATRRSRLAPHLARAKEEILR